MKIWSSWLYHYWVWGPLTFGLIPYCLTHIVIPLTSELFAKAYISVCLDSQKISIATDSCWSVWLKKTFIKEEKKSCHKNGAWWGKKALLSDSHGRMEEWGDMKQPLHHLGCLYGSILSFLYKCNVRGRVGDKSRTVFRHCATRKPFRLKPYRLTKHWRVC